MASEIESKKEWDKKVIGAYSKVLKSVPKIASGLLSLVFIGYLVGWIRARAYFLEFGAEWILSDLSLSYLLSLSVWPILAILISLILTMTDIAERLVGQNLQKAIKFLVIGFLLLHFGSMALEYYQNYESSIFIAYAKVFYSASILMIIFGEKIIQLREDNYKWSSQKIWELALWTVLFLLSCNSLGNAEGYRDANSKVSGLPNVIVSTSEKQDNWRLLYSKNNNLYITELNSKESKIRIIKAEEALYIE
jgi:type III secretory pathway component EscS